MLTTDKNVARANRFSVSPDGRLGYVTNTTSSTVSVVDAAASRALTAVAVDASPIGIASAPDGRVVVYVASSGSNTISIIGTTSHTAIARITVGTGPRDLTVTPDGSRVYVSRPGANTIVKVGTAALTIAASCASGFGFTRRRSRGKG